MVNVPIGVVAVALTPRLLPESVGASARVDVVELLLSVAMLTAAILPLLEGRRLQWPVWTWLVLAGAVAMAAALALRSRAVRRRGGQSLLDPAPFAARAIRVAMAGQGLMFVGMASYFLFLAIYLQQGRGLSPLRSGLVFSMLAAAYLVGTRRAPSLLARHGRMTIIGGASAFAAGHVLLLAAVHEIGVGGAVMWLAPGLVVSGLGMGVCLSALIGTVMATVGPEHAATVSGSLSTVQQLGNAFGVAVLGMVFFGRLHDGVAAAFDTTLVCLAAVTAALALLGAALPRR
jgi:predicted MFS family arabinose efflux permease